MHGASHVFFFTRHGSTSGRAASAPTQERNGATTLPTAQSSFRARTQCKSLRMDDLDTILIILPQHIISTSFSGLFFYCRNVPARTLLRSHAHASPSQLSGTSAEVGGAWWRLLQRNVFVYSTCAKRVLYQLHRINLGTGILGDIVMQSIHLLC